MPKPAATQPQPRSEAARKRVSVLGATGSIGENTLRVLDEHPGQFEIVALTAQDNVEKLAMLARKYKPRLVAIGNEMHLDALREALAGTNTRIVAGSQGLEEAANTPADISVCAIVGAAGLLPTMCAIAQGNHVAIANKETLVCAGELVMQACMKHGTRLLPVDSEHNAIFQVFATEHRAAVEKITLTASGGPFLKRPLDTLDRVTPEEAIAHPRWNMGAKISVDSATMMNKGLELIEAHYLFAMPPEKLDVLIHPESIVHSLVHYADGSVLAQLGMPDMRIPIGYALGWPSRLALTVPKLDLAAMGSLHFEKLEEHRFPALALARAALSSGPSQMIALNAANEIAVQRFLKREIPFTAIAKTVETVLETTRPVTISTLGDVLAADSEARRKAQTI